MASVHEFWSDRMADEIIARVEADPQLKALAETHGYFLYDEKTPSGEIHIGSARGWVIHDTLAKALRAKGKRARFVLSSDDYDPFDKPIKGKPEYDEYLGVPFKNMPPPVEGYANWGDYYFTQSTELFPQWGIDAELASTGQDYQDGVFNAAIKTALDSTEKIKRIFEEIYEKPYDKLPFNPICERCGKIGTTLATAWDAEQELVTYECREDLVKWAKGCGHEGTMKPYDGAGKLPWKVEWAAKWPSKGVIVETAGKDHFTKKGSRTVSNRIAVDVYGYPPPYPSNGYDEGKGYEFVNFGGKKMSTSKGVGAGFAYLSSHVPPKILRFLLTMYKPTSVIDFDPSRPNDVLLLYDRYDTAERVYFGEEHERKEELSQTYAYSHVGPIPKERPPQLSLRHAAVMVQIFERNGEAISRLQEEGHLPAELPDEARTAVEERLDAARQWLREYAPENEKFRVQESVSDEVKASLGADEKRALAMLADELDKTHDERSLFDAFYTICEATGVKNTAFFKAAYSVLLAKPRGPKLANLILTLGKERVRRLLGQL